MQPLAESAIADLVVVLEEADEGGRRQVAARLAARGPRGSIDHSPWNAKPSARQRPRAGPGGW